MRNLGFGLGLRTDFYEDVLAGRATSDWFEIISDNFLGIKGVGRGAAFRKILKIRESYPLVMHGVDLNIGSSDPLNTEYVKSIKELASFIEPEWISDHLCWTGVEGKVLHDLMPLPYNLNSLNHVAERVMQVQDILERPILLENVSAYIDYRDSTMTEWEFISQLVTKAGCKLLLDLNNIFVSSFNQKFDPMDFLRGVPSEAVQQIHLAGPYDGHTHLIDTHDHQVRPEVWNLYRQSLSVIGVRSTMIERDDQIPSLAELEEELSIAREIAKEYLSQQTADILKQPKRGDTNEISL